MSAVKQDLEFWVKSCNLFEEGKFDDALAALGAIKEPNSKHKYNEAIISMVNGSLKPAIRFLNESLGKDEHLAVAYCLRGVVSFLIGYYKEAQINFQLCADKMHGRPKLEYKQLGLKVRLAACEVYANLALSAKKGGNMDVYEEAFALATDTSRHLTAAHADIAQDTEKLWELPLAIFVPPQLKISGLLAKQFMNTSQLKATLFERDKSVQFEGEKTLKTIKASQRVLERRRAPRPDRPAITVDLLKRLAAAEKGFTHVAQYDYEPQGEGEVAMKAGDMVIVIQDLGDGWCRGKVPRLEKEGILPLSYLQDLGSKNTSPSSSSSSPTRRSCDNGSLSRGGNKSGLSSSLSSSSSSLNQSPRPPPPSQAPPVLDSRARRSLPKKSSSTSSLTLLSSASHGSGELAVSTLKNPPPSALPGEVTKETAARKAKPKPPPPPQPQPQPTSSPASKPINKPSVRRPPPPIKSMSVRVTSTSTSPSSPSPSPSSSSLSASLSSKPMKPPPPSSRKVPSSSTSMRVASSSAPHQVSSSLAPLRAGKQNGPAKPRGNIADLASKLDALEEEAAPVSSPKKPQKPPPPSSKKKEVASAKQPPKPPPPSVKVKKGSTSTADHPTAESARARRPPPPKKSLPEPASPSPLPTNASPAPRNIKVKVAFEGEDLAMRVSEGCSLCTLIKKIETLTDCENISLLAMSPLTGKKETLSERLLAALAAKGEAEIELTASRK